jgi:hypothetical protein
MEEAKRGKLVRQGLVLTLLPFVTFLPVLFGLYAMSRTFDESKAITTTLFWLYIGASILSALVALIKFSRAYDRKYDSITLSAFVGSVLAIGWFLFLVWQRLPPDYVLGPKALPTLASAFVGSVVVLCLVWRLTPRSSDRIEQ